MSILAVDQGTTSTRALVVDENGVSRLVKSIEHKRYYPRSGWVEHDPEELIENIITCIKSANDISAIGIDNQGESCLGWDADSKQAISPVIVWQDNRTRGVIKKLVADGAEQIVNQIAGLPLDCYFSASKLAWILNNIPRAEQLQKRGALRLGTTDAYFLDCLVNRFVTDVTTASRTSLMNLKTAQWDPQLCELFGVPVETLPTIVSSTGEFGTLKIDGKHIPIRASIVDQQASLYGHGCRHPGDAKITFGTGAFALVLTGTQIIPSHDRGILPTVAWKLADAAPIYALDGGVYCAGSAVNWAKSLGFFDRYSQINQFQTPSAVERNLVFVPALTGLASPHWDRSAAGLWIGLSLDTQPMDMMQSLLEGIAFRAAEVLVTISDDVTIDQGISIDGGISANPYFCQFLANLLGIEVNVKKDIELTAFGTAMLASRDNIKIESSICNDTVFRPDRDLQQYLEKFKQAVNRSRGWK